MFTIQHVHIGEHYCICKDSWKSFKIVDINLANSKIKIDITSYGGLTKNLVDIKQYRCAPYFLQVTDFEFEPREHVKIEVYGFATFGGHITILGQSYNGGMNSNISETCPFMNINADNNNKIVDEMILT